LKKGLIIVLVLGIALLIAAVALYAIRIGTCYPGSLPQLTPAQTLQFRQDCSLDSSRVVQFSGFLLFFIPGVLLVTGYWLVRPPASKALRPGPLASFLLLTLFDSLLLAVLSLLSYPEAGLGSARAAWFMAGFGLAAYISLLGIWQWKRWGLLVFQGVTVLLTIYTGASGLTMLPATVAIFSAIYLTLVLRPLRPFMD
jgi:hypothetical protein